MRLERGDHVRLLARVAGVPEGTHGTIIGFRHVSRVYVVEFAEYGTEYVPEDAVEPAAAED